MSKSLFIPIAGLILVFTLVAGAVAFFETGDEAAPSSETQAEPTDTAAPETANPVATARYRPYSASDLQATDATTKVLFFKASWCPTCRILEEDIEDNLENIPADWVIYSVDYDTADALKEEYRVATQHTLIYLDADNTQTAKWSALLSLEDVLQAASI